VKSEKGNQKKENRQKSLKRWDCAKTREQAHQFCPLWPVILSHHNCVCPTATTDILGCARESVLIQSSPFFPRKRCDKSVISTRLSCGRFFRSFAVNYDGEDLVIISNTRNVHIHSSRGSLAEVCSSISEALRTA